MAKFSKILSNTDTNTRLSVPMKFLKSLPPFKFGSHAVKFEAADGKGKAWGFQCSIRKRGHPKPVLTKGWLAFVNSKKLKTGDKVTFSKYKNRKSATTSYMVRAEKQVKIFGATFGYAAI